MRRAGAIVAAFLAAVLAAGYLGRLAGPFDSLALLRMPVALLLLATGLFLPRGWRAAAVVLAAVALTGLVRTGFDAEASAPDLRLYQKNTYFANRDGRPLVADILASGADVVTLQELSSRNREIVEGLAQAYPWRHACTYHGWAIAVLSRLPPVEGSQACSEGRGMAVMQVQSAAGPVWIASVHVPWPWPHRGWDIAQQLADQLAGLRGPVAVAGDFNMVPWSQAVRLIAEAARAQVVGPARGTLHIDLWGLLTGRSEWTGLQGDPVPLRHLPMAIDHVLAPGGQVSKRPLFGSDHAGLVADLNIGGG